MQIRKIFFWLHLIAGAVAGVIILIMSVTGVALTYEKQMTAWFDRSGFTVQQPAGANRAPLEDLLANAAAAQGAMPDSIIVRADPSLPVDAAYGRESTLLLNPYTGEVLGEGSSRARAFFRLMTDWHRWLGTSEEGRTTARAITGACNLAFLFLVSSGLYLWWPRQWTLRHLRPIVWFRSGVSGKARDFNWHNVVGFWCCVPLFLVVLGGAVISYPWASSLVYSLHGEQAPQGRGAPGRGPRSSSERARPIELTGINRLLEKAQNEVPAWRTITVRLPQSRRAPVTFSLETGTGGQPQNRVTLALNRATGEVENRTTFADGTPGQRMRTWFRFLHTGEYYGIAGQTIAGLASLGGAFLVYTGIALALRRFAAWVRRRVPATAQVPLQSDGPAE